MRVLNIGSMNLDHVYTVDHIVKPGETQSTTGKKLFLGGKGINQSIALARAGATVYHGGMIGEDGQMFIDACKEYGVNYDYIRTVDGPTGHTIIQIDKNGQNSILLFGGANRRLTREYIDEVINDFDKGDYLLLQNEVNNLAYIVDKAYEKGMKIVLNPSPFDEALGEVDFNKISLFLINEIEGEQITGCKKSSDIVDAMKAKYPNAQFVLTLGQDGAIFRDGEKEYYQSAVKVNAIDTTAAGDTFTGYFITGLIEGLPIEDVLSMSAKAAAICVTREGAVPSIPCRNEIL